MGGKEEKKKKSKSKKDKKDKSHKKHEKKDKHKKHKKDRDAPSSSNSSTKPENALIGPQIPAPFGIGPQLPSSVDIGPQLPPGICLQPAELNPDNIGPDSSSDDSSSDDGPQEAPPAPAPKQSKPGPMLPPGVDLEKLAAQRDKIDWQQVAIEEEEEEADAVGPAMLGRETIGYMRATAAAEARAYNEMLSQMEAEEQSKHPKHEEWMTALPEHRDLSFTVEEMQQNRTFMRKDKEAAGDGSAWTETPADRERKARERRLGIAGKRKAEEEGAALAAARPKNPPQSAATASASALISEYNAAGLDMRFGSRQFHGL